jgi:hypothetical protein
MANYGIIGVLVYMVMYEEGNKKGGGPWVLWNVKFQAVTDEGCESML